MEQHELQRIIDNEREWREYLMEKLDALDVKVDNIDKELATFKVRVFALASVFGTASGLGTNFVFKFFAG